MAYVLSEERDIDVVKPFERYNRYLQSLKHRFPPLAFEFATSQWYFDPNEHKCPHDGLAIGDALYMFTFKRAVISSFLQSVIFMVFGGRPQFC